MSRALGRRLFGLLAVALGGALMTGCEAAFNQHRASLAAMHADGRFDAAARSLDDPENHRLYGEKNELLWLLDRGAVALPLGDDGATLDLLGRAEDVMATRRSETFTESAAVLLMNDTHRPYLGEPYEDMYVNVFKLLAQLEAGRVQGGATVEARRMALKGDQLRDEFLRVEPRVREEAHVDGSAPGSAPGSARYHADSGGEFVESPLGIFLTAVTFMHTGESSEQEVAGRRLEQAISAEAGMIGPVRAEAFEGLGERRAPGWGSGKGSLLVVAFSGRGPHKVSSRQSAGSYFVDLPVLRWSPSAAHSAVFTIDGGAAEGMDLVEDLSSVANENHKRQMPIIYARAYARATAKAVGVGFATWGASTAHNDLATIAVLLGGLALLHASEQADLRSWEFLPGQAHVRLIEVAAGRHEVGVSWLGGAPTEGTLYASGRRVVEVPEGGLTTVVEFWWR